MPNSPSLLINTWTCICRYFVNFYMLKRAHRIFLFEVMRKYIRIIKSGNYVGPLLCGIFILLYSSSSSPIERTYPVIHHYNKLMIQYHIDVILFYVYNCICLFKNRCNSYKHSFISNRFWILRDSRNVRILGHYSPSNKTNCLYTVIFVWTFILAQNGTFKID